jgi:hypothetical protein
MQRAFAKDAAQDDKAGGVVSAEAFPSVNLNTERATLAASHGSNHRAGRLLFVRIPDTQVD